MAKKVTEAQLQDLIRTQIDNLYTVYVGVVAAGLTERFSEVYLKGITRLYGLNQQLYNKGQIKQADFWRSRRTSSGPNSRCGNPSRPSLKRTKRSRCC